MTTRRTLLKSLAGLIGIGIVGKVSAADGAKPCGTVVRFEGAVTSEEDKMQDIAAMLSRGDTHPLISVNTEQSREMGYDRLARFDVVGPTGKTVDSVVLAVDEREGWIFDVESEHRGDYRIVGLTKAQREEHVRRYG